LPRVAVEWPMVVEAPSYPSLQPGNWIDLATILYQKVTVGVVELPLFGPWLQLVAATAVVLELRFLLVVVVVFVAGSNYSPMLI